MSSTSLRIARLQKEYEKIQELAARSPFVRIQSTQGNPPEKYTLQLTCKGITRLSGNKPVISESHTLQIILPEGYPRERPEFDFRTEMFNPNVYGSGRVCIGDEGDHGYAPAMGLDDLVIRIVQIVRYENINPRSSANMIAGAWAATNMSMFPLDKRQIVGEELVSIKIEDNDVSITILDKPDDLGIVISNG